MRLEDGFGDGNREQIVFTRLDGIESVDEQRECPIKTSVDNHALRIGPAFDDITVRVPPSSAIICMRPKALSQNTSNSALSAATPSGLTW